MKDCPKCQQVMPSAVERCFTCRPPRPRRLSLIAQLREDGAPEAFAAIAAMMCVGAAVGWFAVGGPVAAAVGALVVPLLLLPAEIFPTP